MRFRRSRSLGSYSLGLGILATVCVGMFLVRAMIVRDPDSVLRCLASGVLALLFLGAAAWQMRRPHRVRVEPERVLVTGLFGLFPREIARLSLTVEARDGWLGERLCLTGVDRLGLRRRAVVCTRAFSAGGDLRARLLRAPVPSRRRRKGPVVS